MFFTKKFQNGIFFNNNEKTLKEFKEKKYRYKSIFWKNRKIIEKYVYFLMQSSKPLFFKKEKKKIPVQIDFLKKSKNHLKIRVFSNEKLEASFF